MDTIQLEVIQMAGYEYFTYSMAKRSNKITDKDAQAFLDQIAERLKQLRAEQGYTSQETFAYEKDINRVQYGRYERAEEDFRMSTLMKIINAFDITAEEFFSEGFD